MMLDFIGVLCVLILGVHVMSNVQLERLRGEVAEVSSAVDSAVTLIGGLSTALRDLLDNTPPEDLGPAIGELADSLDASANRLGAAVAAGTVAEDDSDVVDVDGNVVGENTEQTDELVLTEEAQPNPLPVPEPSSDTTGESVGSTDGPAPAPVDDSVADESVTNGDSAGSAIDGSAFTGGSDTNTDDSNRGA